MCERAIKLQKYIDEWLEQELALKSNSHPQGTSADSETVADFRDLKRLRLTPAEWSHLRAVTQMLKNFKDATNHLSNNQTPQVPYIWMMYNRLFDFLDQMTVELGSRVEVDDADDWPDVVKNAALQGKTKLSKYYAKTANQAGILFNCATILDPTQKLTAYEV
jgi:hypothetical protein